MEEVIEKVESKGLNKDEILLVILTAVAAFTFAVGIFTLATLFTPETRLEYLSIDYYAFNYRMQAVFGAFMLGMSYFIGVIALCGWIQFLHKTK